jgi:hypothetical protein
VQAHVYLQNTHANRYGYKTGEWRLKAFLGLQDKRTVNGVRRNHRGTRGRLNSVRIPQLTRHDLRADEDGGQLGARVQQRQWW